MANPLACLLSFADAAALLFDMKRGGTLVERAVQEALKGACAPPTSSNPHRPGSQRRHGDTVLRELAKLTWEQ